MPAWQLASLVGLVVGLPALIWTLGDLRRVPGSVWDRSPYSRTLWTTVAVVGYVVGGWPAVVVAAAWRFSRDRADLVEETLGFARAEARADAD
jgi:hypothetical protein